MKQISEIFAAEYQRVMLAVIASLKLDSASIELYYPSLLPTDKLVLLEKYFLLLQEWTKKVDLVSEAEPLLIIQRHFIDSLVAGQIIFSKLKSKQRVLDLGSGAGFPGLVMAIMDSNCKFYLCEPREKRTIFLREAIRRLGLTNVILVSKRFEDIQEKDYDIDLIVSRALVIDPGLLKKIKALLSKEGHVCLIQGEKSNDLSGLTNNWEYQYEISSSTSKSIVRCYKCFT